MLTTLAGPAPHAVSQSRLGSRRQARHHRASRALPRRCPSRGRCPPAARCVGPSGAGCTCLAHLRPTYLNSFQRRFRAAPCWACPPRGGGGAPSRLRGWGGVEGVWGELFQPSAVSAGALLLGSKPPVPKLVQWASRVGRPSSETGPTSRDKVLGAALHSVLCSRVFFWGRFAEAHGDVHDPLEARSWASGDLGGRLQPGPRPAVASAGSCCSAVRPSLSRRLPACSAAATAAVPWWGV